jgi:hypothetical protein
MALPAGWAWPNGRLRQRVRPTADPRGRGSLIFGDSRSESRSESRFEQARHRDRPPAFKPNVTLGRAWGNALFERMSPSARVSHTGMVEDRIGWKPSLVGKPIPVTLISQTVQRRPCDGTHSIRAFDRREALHHRRPAKIRFVGERGICGFDFFSHTGSIRAKRGPKVMPLRC